MVDAIITIVVLVYSVIIHEISHGVVAGWLGDDTAYKEGRITLNPIPHIDPIMTIALPLILYLSQLNVPANQRIIFGGAKGVPVDPSNFKDQKVDWALVSFAGPFSNFLLAAMGALLAHTAIAQNSIVATILVHVILLNIVLAIFNLVPIPPLDGSKILAGFLPETLAYRFLSLQSFGYIFIFLFLYFHLFDQILFRGLDFFLRLFRLV